MKGFQSLFWYKLSGFPPFLAENGRKGWGTLCPDWVGRERRGRKEVDIRFLRWCRVRGFPLFVRIGSEKCGADV